MDRYKLVLHTFFAVFKAWQIAYEHRVWSGTK